MGQHVIAIDPGTISGVAYFEDGELESVELIKAPWEVLCLYDYPRPLKVVCEFPVIYPGHRGKGSGNDLLTVARIAGKLTGFAENPEFVAPKTWKGNVPKKIMLDRIFLRLSAEERKIIDALKAPKAEKHNAIDAIGIGLWKLGRL